MARHGGSQGIRAARQRSGLRNRGRRGTGPYARKGKGKRADYYGTWKDGKQVA